MQHVALGGDLVARHHRPVRIPEQPRVHPGEMAEVGEVLHLAGGVAAPPVRARRHQRPGPVLQFRHLGQRPARLRQRDPDQPVPLLALERADACLARHPGRVLQLGYRGAAPVGAVSPAVVGADQFVAADPAQGQRRAPVHAQIGVGPRPAVLPAPQHQRLAEQVGVHRLVGEFTGERRPDASIRAAPSCRRTPPEPAWCPSFRMSRPHRAITPRSRIGLVERDQVTSASWHRTGPPRARGRRQRKARRCPRHPCQGSWGPWHRYSRITGTWRSPGSSWWRTSECPHPGRRSWSRPRCMPAPAGSTSSRSASSRCSQRSWATASVTRSDTSAAMRSHCGSANTCSSPVSGWRRPSGTSSATAACWSSPRDSSKGSARWLASSRASPRCRGGASLSSPRSAPCSGSRSGRRWATWPGTTLARSTPTSSATRCTC